MSVVDRLFFWKMYRPGLKWRHQGEGGSRPVDLEVSEHDPVHIDGRPPTRTSVTPGSVIFVVKKQATLCINTVRALEWPFEAHCNSYSFETVIRGLLRAMVHDIPQKTTDEIK